MKVINATEASRSFSAVLDQVEHGESFTIVRGGREVAHLAPASRPNGAAFKALLTGHAPDPEWADDVRAVRALVAEPRTGTA